MDPHNLVSLMALTVKCAFAITTLEFGGANGILVGVGETHC